MVISCDAYEKELKLIKATELRLGLPGTDEQVSNLKDKKRPLMVEEGGETGNETAPPSKAPIVGWPPIRSYRKNNLQVKKSDKDQQISGIYVKVSMDGAPYLRKIDLNNYVGYSELVKGLESMFKFAMGTDYAPTYEDKDGDWMLVGDVPWEMFINSCKRLRIMKGSEARSGRLAPAAAAAAISHVR